ncbi:MAG TPA: tripartite tricarboxylate transporter substrate binding protein [Burkholderiales bacterium]|nr:tripartite tricarboxylate transporter substrate binding protein [Burkholderiales bacterium]
MAQNYPAKPIRIIVPYPPGGTSDILTRMVGQKLTESWGQSVIADSRPGAAGIIGVELTVRAPADGYTLVLMDVGNLTIIPSVYRKVPFDTARDLAPVGMVSYSPHLLSVHPSLPARTTAELIAVAKKQPGKLNYATGLGTAPHFAGMLFTQRAGIKWTDVPGKGGSQSMLQVITGECDVLFLGMLQSIAHAKSGKVRPIAMSSAKRDPSMPDVPTVGETKGLEGFVTGSWQGILAPAKTPPDVITKVNAEVNRIMNLPDMKEKLAAQGTTPLLMSPPEFGKWLVEQKDRWAKLVKETGFKPLEQ